MDGIAIMWRGVDGWGGTGAGVIFWCTGVVEEEMAGNDNLRVGLLRSFGLWKAVVLNGV